MAGVRREDAIHRDGSTAGVVWRHAGPSVAWRWMHAERTPEAEHHLFGIMSGWWVDARRGERTANGPGDPPCPVAVVRGAARVKAWASSACRGENLPLEAAGWCSQPAEPSHHMNATAGSRLPRRKAKMPAAGGVATLLWVLPQCGCCRAARSIACGTPAHPPAPGPRHQRQRRRRTRGRRSRALQVVGPHLARVGRRRRRAAAAAVRAPTQRPPVMAVTPPWSSAVVSAKPARPSGPGLAIVVGAILQTAGASWR